MKSALAQAMFRHSPFIGPAVLLCFPVPGGLDAKEDDVYSSQLG